MRRDEFQEEWDANDHAYDGGVGKPSAPERDKESGDMQDQTRSCIHGTMIYGFCRNGQWCPKCAENEKSATKESGEQVKRYEPGFILQPVAGEQRDMEEDADGEYITYDDHLSALSTLQERVEKLEKERDTWKERGLAWSFAMDEMEKASGVDADRFIGNGLKRRFAEREELSTLRSSFAERAKSAASILAADEFMPETLQEMVEHDAAIILAEFDKEQK